MTREEATIEKINLESALRITNDWLSKVQYDAPYFGSGDMEAIKKALEKQIPKKAEIKEKFPDSFIIECPVCNRRMFKYKFCPNCGQALDWTEEGE